MIEVKLNGNMIAGKTAADIYRETFRKLIGMNHFTSIINGGPIPSNLKYIIAHKKSNFSTSHQKAAIQLAENFWIETYTDDKTKVSNLIKIFDHFRISGQAKKI